MSDRVAFVGIGIMGSGMAMNLFQSVGELVVWNRTKDKLDDLLSAGARAADTLPEVAGQADIIFLCVADTAAVEQVVVGDKGLIDHMQEDSLLVDMSTISPTATVQLAESLAGKGVHMLDAPVSGGSEGARDGTLSIMVGGPDDQFERALPYLQAMGNRITHVGSNGHGQMTKMVNQMLVVGNALAMSEALIFAQAAGLDLERTLDAVTGGAAGSWMLSNRAPQIIHRDWSPGFTIDLQQKDLRLALAEAERLGVPAGLTSSASQLYRILQREGQGSLGNHALIIPLERLAGVEART